MTSVNAIYTNHWAREDILGNATIKNHDLQPIAFLNQKEWGFGVPSPKLIFLIMKEANVVMVEETIFIMAHQRHVYLFFCEGREEESVRSFLRSIMHKGKYWMHACGYFIIFSQTTSDRASESLTCLVCSPVKLSLNLFWEVEFQGRSRTEMLQRQEWPLLPYILFLKKWSSIYLWLFLYLSSLKM